MNVEQFVSETLIQIAKGVQSANDGLEVIDASVNPPGRNSADNKARDVSFDIAVTVETSNEQTASGGAKAWVLSAAAAIETGKSQGSTSRVCFTVPLRLPTGKRV